MKRVRWIVRAEDPRTVEAIVRAAGVDPAAIAAGRVFVGRRRVTDGSDEVAVGDEVTVSEPQETRRAPRIVFHDADWLALDKPAGLVTIPDHGGKESLLNEAAKICKAATTAIHPTSRLDREVSGVVVFAKTKRAREKSMRARELGTYERRYVAIAEGTLAQPEGAWSYPIGKAADPRLRKVQGKDAVPAETLFQGVARAGERIVLLALAPRTGRTHQLRVHASHAGLPLLGDRAYGGSTRLTLPSGKVQSLGRVALHAAWVKFEGLDVRSPIPAELVSLWSTLGGDAGAWDIAMSCALGRP